jgi:guanine deaminase
MDDDTWLERAIALATDNVAAGGGPFGAVITRGDVEVATGTNRVTLDLDPTAHAEVVVIRTAARTIGTHDLSGLTLWSSCEPCPLCLSAALWARLDRVVYAADRDDAAHAGFDDRAFHDLLRGASSDWPARIEHRRTPAALAPFQAWDRHEGRVAY